MRPIALRSLRQTLCVRFDSMCNVRRVTRNCLTLDDSLVSCLRRPPLYLGHATVRAYDHVCLFLRENRNGQNSTFPELAAWRQLCARRYIVYDPAVR